MDVFPSSSEINRPLQVWLFKKRLGISDLFIEAASTADHRERGPLLSKAGEIHTDDGIRAGKQLLRPLQNLIQKGIDFHISASDAGDAFQNICQTVPVFLDCPGLAYGFYAGFHQKLQLVKTIAFFIIALNVQFPDCLYRRSHAFMPRQKNDKQIRVKLPYSSNHLVAAYGPHEKVQKHDVKLPCPHPLDGPPEGHFQW